MKWAHIETVEESRKLLYWVLMYVLSPYFNDPIDHWLKRIMTTGGGIGGDPGWEMEHILDENGCGNFLVWADPEVSGIEPASATYSKETVEEALRESLIEGQRVGSEGRVRGSGLGVRGSGLAIRVREVREVRGSGLAITHSQLLK